MSVSRRQLLQHSVLALAACAAGPLSAWAARNNNNSSNTNPKPPKINNEGLQHLARTAFESAIGTGFQVTPISGKSSPVWLRLLSVNDLPALQPVNVGAMAVPPKQKSATVYTTGFLLSFLSTLPKPLPQGTYNFEHPGLGTFSLLIVPDGPGKETYTATISRLP